MIAVKWRINQAYKEILRNSIRTFEDLDKWLTGPKVAIEPRLKEVISKYPMRVNTYYLSLIEKINDGIWKQAIPGVGELEHYNDLTADALDEEGDIPLVGARTIVHRYPDRVLLLISNECSIRGASKTYPPVPERSAALY